MVDTRDLKSLALNGVCRFESGLRHVFELLDRTGMPAGKGFLINPLIFLVSNLDKGCLLR